MGIIKSELEAVAVKASQYPEDVLPEIAFAGRSNVGKSSLLNLLTGRKSLARVSASPGKTRTINFYLIDDSFRIVDLPGYGYAKAARSVTESWGRMVEGYMEARKGLVRVVQLVDIRHEPTAQDVQMYEYLRHYGLDGTVVATKSDKVPSGQRIRCLKIIREKLRLTEEDAVIPVSALKKTGGDDLLRHMEMLLRDENPFNEK